MKTYTGIEGRDSDKRTFHLHICPVPGTTLLFFIPTLLYLFSCVRLPENSHLLTRTPGHVLTGTDIHIFTYNDDSLMRLDAYQKYESLEGNVLGIDSRSGKKRVVLCANSHHKHFIWKDIQSYQTLGKIRFRLEDEHPGNPLASEEISIRAGNANHPVHLDFTPFLSEIEIRSVRVDFSGTSYEGEALQDIRLYLTNVNAEVSLTEKETSVPGRIVNLRRLVPEDMKDFRRKDMLQAGMEDIKDGSTAMTGIRLYCFPNTAEEESLGTPFTRLVLEGKIRGHTYYYPIAINRTGSPGTDTGVERGCRYSYSITIRRTGTTDPDRPVEPGQVESRLEIEPWNTKEEYEIPF